MKKYIQFATILVFIVAAVFVGYVAWQSQQDQSAEDSSAATITTKDFATEFSAISCSGNHLDLTARGEINGRKISITAKKRTAGAIDSLKLNDYEIVNNWDHGRQIQYAMIINGLGECLNPTEAGSKRDGQGATSTSQVISACSLGTDKFYTKNRPAYWLQQGDKGYCEGGVTQGLRDGTSDYTFEKIVDVGYHNIPNVIRMLFKVTFAEDVDSYQIEVPTGYHKQEFNNFYYVDIKKGELELKDPGPSDPSIAESYYVKGLPQNTVPVLSNGTYAIAAYAPSSFASSVWGFNFGNGEVSTTKWSSAIKGGATSKGTVLYNETFLVVGTHADVLDGLEKLFEKELEAPVSHHLDWINGHGALAGWAYDPDVPAQSVPVRFYYDEINSQNLIAEITANSDRNDVNEYFGITGKHGFNYSITSDVVANSSTRKLLIQAKDLSSNQWQEIATTYGIFIPYKEFEPTDFKILTMDNDTSAIFYIDKQNTLSNNAELYYTFSDNKHTYPVWYKELPLPADGNYKFMAHDYETYKYYLIAAHMKNTSSGFVDLHFFNPDASYNSTETTITTALPTSGDYEIFIDKYISDTRDDIFAFQKNDGSNIKLLYLAESSGYTKIDWETTLPLSSSNDYIFDIEKAGNGVYYIAAFQMNNNPNGKIQVHLLGNDDAFATIASTNELDLSENKDYHLEFDSYNGTKLFIGVIDYTINESVYKNMEVFFLESTENYQNQKSNSILPFLKIISNRSDPEPSPSSDYCLPMDIDGDNQLKILDLSNLVKKFKEDCIPDPNVDYGICGSQDSDGDGTIKIFDVVYAVNRFKTENCAKRE
jgi:outer membrane protein W